MRALLEGYAGRHFATRDPDRVRDDLAALGLAVTHLEHAASDMAPTGLIAAKTAFYAALMNGGGNLVVKQILTTLHNRITLLRLTSMTQPGRLAKSMKEVRAIHRAIVERDGAKAEGGVHQAYRCRRRGRACGALRFAGLTDVQVSKGMTVPWPVECRTARHRPHCEHLHAGSLTAKIGPGLLPVYLLVANSAACRFGSILHCDCRRSNGSARLLLPRATRQAAVGRSRPSASGRAASGA